MIDFDALAKRVEDETKNADIAKIERQAKELITSINGAGGTVVERISSLAFAIAEIAFKGGYYEGVVAQATAAQLYSDVTATVLYHHQKQRQELLAKFGLVQPPVMH